MAVTDEAIEKIKGMIVSGALAPATGSPRRANSRPSSGLSRNSLREAVRALSLIRILDVRQGDGTYVTSLDPQLLLEALGFVVDFHRDDTVLEFFAVRRILEPAATAMAAQRIEEAELDALSAQLDALGPEPSVEELVAGDLEFHRRIVRGLRQLGALLPAGRAVRPDHPGPGVARADPGGRGRPHPARAPGDPGRAAGPGRGGGPVLGDGAHRECGAVAALDPVRARRFTPAEGRRAQPQALHPAVDGERGAGDGRGGRARQVDDGGGHLVGGDQPSQRLAGVERGALGGRVVGLVEQPADPRGVRGAGVDAVDADALADVVGGHREGEGEHGALARAVERALRQPGGGGDGAGLGDRARPRAARRRRGAGAAARRGRCGPCRGR